MTADERSIVNAVLISWNSMRSDCYNQKMCNEKCRNRTLTKELHLREILVDAILSAKYPVTQVQTIEQSRG